jgi:hypothetical protein
VAPECFLGTLDVYFCANSTSVKLC